MSSETPTSGIALQEIRALAAFFEEIKAIDNELPFDLLPSEPLVSKENVTVSVFELPKIGQTTQGEEFVWNHFIDSLGEIDWANMPIETVYRLRCVGVTLLMLFRHDPAWNVGKTLQLGTVQVVELYNFFLGERTGWKIAETVNEPEAEAETATTKKPKASSGRKPSGDSPMTSPTTIDSSETPLAVAG